TTFGTRSRRWSGNWPGIVSATERAERGKYLLVRQPSYASIMSSTRNGLRDRMTQPDESDGGHQE
ncbi:MAG: hypothetical protein P8Y07_14435, partial [Gemmatimonadales bacterium]